MTGIQWTQEVWNPTTGCDKVSPGCDRCYALIMAKRLKGMGQVKYQTDGDPRTSGPGFGLAIHPDSLEVPLHWRDPRKIFVNSMSDLFHPKVPTAFIGAVFDVMAQTPWHTYQILTKRAPRMRSLSRGATFGEHWPLSNVWLGVSAENQEEADRRIPLLLDTRAAVRFVSAEPLLEPIDLSPWIGVRDGIAPASRERGLRSGPEGRVNDRHGRSGLADRSPARTAALRGIALDSLQASASREGYGEIPPGPRDVRGPSSVCASSSLGMAALSWPDTGEPDRESQERSPRRELAGQPRAGHVPGTGNARPSHSQAGPTGPVRSPQCDGETDNSPGSGDLLTASEWRTAEANRGGLRRGHADDIEDRTGRPSLSWLIVGGESGAGARPMEPDWARDIVAQCQDAGTAVFVKQMGSVWARHCRAADSHGGDWDAWPEDLRIRQFPAAAEVIPA